jgi:predicted metal-dependent phosphoesterase TrpH
MGIDLDAEAILQPAIQDSTRAVGRPWIARALVAGGHAATIADAFDRFLSRGRPAFVPRAGATPEEVIAVIHDTGGIASIAHPGLIGRDEWIPGFAVAGVDAIEAYHTDHDADATARYLAAAAQHGLLVTGGSDYHGDERHGGRVPGSVSLPRDAFDRLVAKNRAQRK